MFKKLRFLQVAVLPVSVCVTMLANSSANALPGETADAVSSWIKANPTLRPNPGERFLVTKSDTPAQRFSFQASVFPPGRIEYTKDRSTIRNEQLSLYDAINGVTLARLEESLRTIYGADIYRDFAQAEIVYEYPRPGAMSGENPIKDALRGQLRVGDRFAYWTEIAQPQNNKSYTGQLTVFLKSDLEKLTTELRQKR